MILSVIDADKHTSFLHTAKLISDLNCFIVHTPVAYFIKLITAIINIITISKLVYLSKTVKSEWQ